MRLLITYFAACWLVFGVGNLSAQRAKDWAVLGDRAMESNDAYGALRYYDEAMKLDSAKAELNYKYAEALRATQNYPLAAYYYRKVYMRERAKVFPESGIWMASMQKQSGDYKEAKTSWRKVRKQFENNKSDFWYEKAIQEMRACDLAQEWSTKPDTAAFEMTELPYPVNANGSSFDGRWIGREKFEFTSLRGEFDDKGRLTSSPEEYAPKIYEGDSTFVTVRPAELSEPETIAERHFANWKAIVKRVENRSELFLFEGDELRAQWPIEPGDSSDYTQPSFGTVDERAVLFMASDRAGGAGGYDLWYMDLAHLSNLENAGETVNTPGNEITPHFSAGENALYFSSDYHLGLGGFDVFKSDVYGELFGQPENLKQPFNTTANDLYYHFDEKASKGMLTSNRGISEELFKAGCCNKLFAWELPLDYEPKMPVFESLEELNTYLPVKLYFHNDEPDPRTRNPETKQNYSKTYAAYVALLPDYQAAYRKGLTESAGDEAEEAMDQFFLDQVDKGAADLELFTRLLQVALEKGERVKLTVKGFASPLAKTDYNVHLTSRRISSLTNYLKAYDRGVLKPYFDGSASNGASLEIVAIPFGEYLAAEAVNDNPNEQDAVYGIGAALERKIEIVSIQRSAADSLQSDIRFERELVDLGSVPLGTVQPFSFLYRCEGDFTIDSLQYDSTVVRIEKIAMTCVDGENGELAGEINTENLRGKRTLFLILFGTFAEGRKELNITFQTTE